MRPLLLSAVLILTGCSHTLTLMSKDGTTGTGTASVGVGTGTFKAALEGDTYRGRWTAVGGGSTSVGTVLARSDRGGSLRCRFTYGGFTDAGFGTCQDADGKDYEMQIQ